MKALLIVIDFINDIVHASGKVSSVAPFVAENNVIQHANEAIAIARERQIAIAHVKVGFSSNYIECPQHSPLFGKAKALQALKLGTWGTEFHGEIDVQQSDAIIIKHRVSALYSTNLSTILTANQIDTVIISGVSTSMAVDTLTRELHDRDYAVIVLKDACGAATREAHESSLATLERIATICYTKDLAKHIN